MVKKRKEHVNAAYGKKTRVYSLTLDETGRVVAAASYVGSPITSIKSANSGITVSTTTNNQTGEAEVTLSASQTPAPGTIVERGITPYVGINPSHTFQTKVPWIVLFNASILVTLETVSAAGPYGYFITRSGYNNAGVWSGQITVTVYGNAIQGKINYAVIA